jgi:hypothetical protein
LFLTIARSFLAPKKIKNKIRSHTCHTSPEVVATAALVAAQSKPLQSLLAKASPIDLKEIGWLVLIRPFLAGFDSTPDIT